MKTEQNGQSIQEDITRNFTYLKYFGVVKHNLLKYVTQSYGLSKYSFDLYKPYFHFFFFKILRNVCPFRTACEIKFAVNRSCFSLFSE